MDWRKYWAILNTKAQAVEQFIANKDPEGCGEPSQRDE